METAIGEQEDGFDGKIRWLEPQSVHFKQGAPHDPLSIVIDGATHSPVRARLAFPKSRPDAWIQIERIHPENSKVIPVGMIRAMADLNPNDRKLVESSLRRTGAVPLITRIIGMEESRNEIRWSVETDRGPCEFRIRQPHRHIIPLNSGRVLFIDDEENRYEITDVSLLDPRSQALLERVI